LTSVGSHEVLRFTGNWYIDLCILGFMKIMEKYYGWTLNELEQKIRENEVVVFKKFFPVAYVAFYLEREIYKVINELEKKKKEKREKLEREYDRLRSSRSKRMSRRIEKIETEIANIDAKIELLRRCVSSLRREVRNLEINGLSAPQDLDEEVFEQAWSKILELHTSVAKVFGECREISNKARDHIEKDIDDKGNLKRLMIRSDFYLNFMIFQYGYGLNTQKECLKVILSADMPSGARPEVLERFDRTINKFLFSQEKIKNVLYAPMNYEIVCKMLRRYPLVFLMCFEAAFEFLPGLGYYAFYSPDIEFTYDVNKRLRVMKGHYKARMDIFRITWRAVIDSLYERHATWVLEDMYLVRYGGIKQQRLIDVEYIGIDKLRASLILNDKIRNSLNERLVIIKKEDKKERLLINVWLIEKFLQGHSLFPMILMYFKHKVSDNDVNYPRHKLIRALATEFALKKLRKTLGCFSFEFLNSQWIPMDYVKRFLLRLKTASKIAGVLSSMDREKLASLMLRLISILEKRNRSAFMDFLLTELNKYDVRIPRDILKTIFNNVFMERNWEYFALGLLISLWR